MKKRQSKYLINQNQYYISWSDGPGSGWNYDGRGALQLNTDHGPYSISNVTGKYPTALIRETQIADSGIYTLETYADIKSGFDGFVLSLYDKDETDIMRLFTKDGCFYAIGKDYEKVLLLDCNAGTGRYYFRIILDFDNKSVTYYINSHFCAVLHMLCDSFKYYKIGTLGTDIIDVEPGALDLYADFITNSSFITTAENSFPYDWQKYGEGEFFVSNDELHINSSSSRACVTKCFEKADGNLIFDTYFFTPEHRGSFELSLMSGEKSALKLCFSDCQVMCKNKVLRDFKANLWYRLRITIDTKKHKALVQFNGKDPYSLDFDADFTDTVLFAAQDDAKLIIDDVKMYFEIEYDDYCPQPIPTKGYGKYNVGINMCSLWHTGDHVGWDCITPYPETKPFMGYYDEGLPEVADWEIKFMVENGITAQFYCWYTDASQRHIPLKKTRLNTALVDGFMHAKYSHMMKFGLLWEANGGRPGSKEAFRENFVPYWIENFFSDKRYVSIDNKALMGVFAPEMLIKEFGSPDALKEEFDYLRNEVKKLGYDDLIIFCSATPNAQLKQAGFDACYAYGWGKNGYDYGFSKGRLDSMKALSDIMHFIPTASTGYNRISWGSPRVPCMTVSDFKKLNTYMRDELLPSFKNEPDWTHKFVMLSNWNEYGEGTYINPTGLNGFGYVNAIRDVYTDGKADGAKDIKPTKNQLKRLSYLYPQDRKTIRPLQLKPKDNDSSLYSQELVSKPLDLSRNSWLVEEADTISTKNSLRLISNGNDAKITYKKPLNIPCSKAQYIRIVMSTSSVCDGVVYYRTTSHPEWSGKNAADFTPVPGKTEYIVNLQNGRLGNNEYSGKLLEIRIDPSTVPGITSEIMSVELFSPINAKPQKQLFIDKQNIILDNEISLEKGHCFVPLFPERAIVHKLHAFYKWNDTQKKLSLYTGNASIAFYIGTSKAEINGETVYLDCVPYLDDGLPMIPLDIVCDVFGYKLTCKENNLYVKTQN